MIWIMLKNRKWQDIKMRILLTGARGMVGHNILEHRGADKHEWLTPSRAELDLLNYAQILDYMGDKGIDLVLHCAGKVGGIEANMEDPAGFLNENLLMGVNLVNAAHKAKVKRLINLASSCMYPKDYKNPLKEEYILEAGLEPTNEGYALAKIVVAKLCEYLSAQHDLAYKTLIPCNIYGRWDKFDTKNAHMLPAVIKRIHDAKVANQPVIEIWGDGKACREFMYAADCADAIYFVVENFDRVGRYTNIGVGYDSSMKEYYETIAGIIGYVGEFKYDLSKPRGMQQKLVDNTKLKDLGWVASHSLEQGIAKTYEFFLERQNG